MKYTTRTDFPETLPTSKTFFCWHCHVPGATRRGRKRVTYVCDACGRSSGRVLIYDQNMQHHFDGHGRLVHESCGVFITRADGKLLLFKRTKFPYQLTIPAGHLEIGEEAETCAMRETEEEIGVRPPGLMRIFEGDIEGDSCLGGADIHHWSAYACAINTPVEVTFDGEGESWGWYDAAELTTQNTVQPVIYLLSQDEVKRGLTLLGGRGGK